jgi:hypothetical protein
MSEHENLVDHEQWFNLSYDEQSGMLVQGRFVDEKMHVRYLQEIPDNFFDVNRHLGDEAKSLVGDTQDHRRLVARVPNAITNQWAEEDRLLDDDEKAAKFKERMNSNEFHKLRVSRGAL